MRQNRLHQQFLDLVDSCVDAERNVQDIADALGVPLRTLQQHVSSASGRTPSALLRDARFRKAHALLAAADPTRDTVTAIAERCGFGHLGRFSVEYRARYGCSPAHTLAS
jgi:transcriptional regulator GlxA family with amidase domain